MKLMIAPWAALAFLSLAGCVTPVSDQSERINRMLSPPSLYGERESDIIEVIRDGETEDRQVERETDDRPSAMRACINPRPNQNLQRTFLAYCRESALATWAVNSPAPGTEGSDATREASVARAYFDAGVGLSNAICQRYLTDMSLRGVTFSALDSYVDTTGIALTTILPATGSPQRAIEVTGALFQWLSGISQSSSDLFAFDTLEGDVYNLVRNYRFGLLASRASQSPRNFWQAFTWLEQYHSTCSYISIRTLVRDAVSARTRQYERDIANTVPFPDALAAALGVDALTGNQAAAVVLYVNSGGRRAEAGDYQAALATNVTRAGATMTLKQALEQAPAGQGRDDMLRRLSAIASFSAEGREILARPDQAFSAETPAPAAAGIPPGTTPPDELDGG